MYDLAVIGGGPAGYSAALTSAQKGAKTVLVEKEFLGGTCLNYGCIPTKYLIKNIEIYKSAVKAGFIKELNGKPLDFEKMNADMCKTIGDIRKGAEAAALKHKVDVVFGSAVLKNKNSIKAGEKEIGAKNTVIAVGTKSARLDGLFFDGGLVINSDQALYLKSIPETMVFVGGGFVGVELAYIFSLLGSEVTIIEKEKQLLPGWDAELVKELLNEFGRSRVKIYAGCTVSDIKKSNESCIKLEVSGEKNESIYASKAVLCLNRKPAVENIGLAMAGVELKNGSVYTDSFLRTSAENIFCAGDARFGSRRLAYTAHEEGATAARNALGENIELVNCYVPYVLFTKPELGFVGSSEADLIANAAEYKKGASSFAANPRASITSQRRGWVKVLACDNRIVGVQAAGSDIGEIINAAAVMIKSKIDIRSVNRSLCIHPCWGETFFEAIEKAR